MDKKCKCDSCGAEKDCPRHCDQCMDEKEDGQMHCAKCGQMEDKPKCDHCGVGMNCHHHGEHSHHDHAQES